MPKKPNFLYHLHPPTVPGDALHLTRTWGLGGLSLVLAVIQLVTGLLLLFQYCPEISRAYDSILVIQDRALFGKLFRNLHHWGANALIVTVFFHMLRVFFTGACSGTRKVNWWIGLALFLSVILSNFTGYLLPFDQLSYWAITISMGMFDYVPWAGELIREIIMGGPDISQATLSNFYALHIAFIPATMAVLLAFHFWKVRKAGGVVLPQSPGTTVPAPFKKVPAVPHLVTREVTAALVITAFIFLLSVLFDATLSGTANTGMSPNPAKPPWYFAGLQELLQHFHPVFAVFIIPLTFCALLVLVPYIKKERPTAGHWFISSTGRKTSRLSAGCALVLVPVLIVLNETTFQTWPLFHSRPLLITSGLVPFLLVLSIAGAQGFYATKVHHAAQDEIIQAVTVFFIVSFAILTIVGIWFRGTGMTLCWPWEIAMTEIANITP